MRLIGCRICSGGSIALVRATCANIRKDFGPDIMVAPKYVRAIRRAFDAVTTSEHRIAKSTNAQPAPSPTGAAPPQSRASIENNRSPRFSANTRNATSSSGIASSNASHPSTITAKSPPAIEPACKATNTGSAGGALSPRPSNRSYHHVNRICPIIGSVVDATIRPSVASRSNNADTSPRTNRGA